MSTRRIAAVLVASLVLSAPAWAELNAYMSVKAQKQGDIKGSVTQKGRDGKMMVIAVDHLMLSPTDPASGLPTGRRQHKPFVITKEIDKSTPPLRSAFVNNENLPEVKIEFWTPQLSAMTGTGQEKQNFTVTLSNARIVSVRHVMPNNKNPELMKFAAYEEIGFAYQKITWTWNDGGITASDDWEARF